MKKHIFITLLAVGLLSAVITPKSALASDRFNFIISDGSQTVQVGSDSNDPSSFVTSASSVTLQVEPIEDVTGKVLVRTSNTSWNGTGPVTNAGGVWTVPVSPGSYSLSARIGDTPETTDAQAFITLTVQAPAQAGAAFACSPHPEVDLSWPAVPGPTYYNIYRNDASDPVQRPDNSWVDDGHNWGALTPGVTYTYTIQAIQNGVVLAGKTVTVSTTPSVCAAHIGITGQSCPAGTTWSASTGNTGSSVPGSFNFTPSANGTTVTLSAAASGYSVSISPASSQVVSPGDSSSFSLTCIPHTIAITLSSSNNPYQCSAGTTISWSTFGATSCSAPWTSSTAVSGSQWVTPTESPQTYSMTCSSATENKTSSIDVTASDAQGGSCPAQPDPASVSISASPTTISNGQSSTISWSSDGATSCSAWWTSKTTTSGTQVVSPVTNTNYAMTCSGPGGSGSNSANVTVTPASSNVAVTSNMATSWIISDNLGHTIGADSGTSHSYGVTPLGGGTVYTISPAAISGYSVAVTNNVTGSGSSFSLFGGDSGVFSLTYSSGSGFTYSLSNGGTTNGAQGGSAQEVITKTLTSGTAQSVALSVQGSLPTGVTLSGISSQGCTLTCASTATFSIASDAPAGDHTIVLVGTPGSVTTSFTLHIAASPDVSVSCNASPAVAKIGQNVSWTATVSGGTAPFTYTWAGTGIPTAPHVPTSNPYALSYSTVGSKSAVATVTDKNGKTGSCVAGTAVVNVNPTFQEF